MEFQSRLIRKLGWGCVCMASMAVGGCETMDSSTAKTAAPAARVEPKRVVVEQPTDGWSRATIALPTGVKETSVLWLERVAPTEVTLGQTFDYEIRVTNISANVLQDIQIIDNCAANFKLTSSSPEAHRVDGSLLRWELGSVAAGETRTIRVSGQGVELGALKNCLSASYESRVCLAINVVKPNLQLAMKAPAEVLKCDAIPVQYILTNTGNGVARNVALEDQLPNGLTTEKGSKTVEANIGDLQVNESKAVNVTLKAGAAGKFENQAQATADGGLKAEAVATTVVHKPELVIEKTGPDKVFVGRNVSYAITVTNKGDGEARDTVLEDVLPAGVKLVAATQGTVAEGGKLVWRLGKIKPGDSVKATVTVEPAGISVIENTAVASAYCASAVRASVKTEVQGIPAILLEVIDLSDPIEVGGNETYEITATNQGSAQDSNIKIACTLEDGMEFVSADGATKGTSDGKSVKFEALSALAPKAKATWRVTVKAVNSGDVRFQVVLTTDQLKRPVQETEATNFYK